MDSRPIDHSTRPELTSALLPLAVFFLLSYGISTKHDSLPPSLTSVSHAKAKLGFGSPVPLPTDLDAHLPSSHALPGKQELVEQEAFEPIKKTVSFFVFSLFLVCYPC